MEVLCIQVKIPSVYVPPGDMDDFFSPHESKSGVREDLHNGDHPLAIP